MARTGRTLSAATYACPVMTAISATLRARGSLVAAASMAIAALAGAGCGGSTPSKPLTRAQLTAKANAICQRIVSEVDWSKVTAQELPKVVVRLASLEEQAAAELGQLVAPPSIADEWQVVIDGFKLTGPEFRKIARDAQHSPQAYPKLPLSNAQHERALDANILHIKECAKY